MERIASVQWINAHRPDAQQAATLGFTQADWQGNKMADLLANKGIAMHPVDLAIHNTFETKINLVQSIQRHMLHT